MLIYHLPALAFSRLWEGEGVLPQLTLKGGGNSYRETPGKGLAQGTSQVTHSKPSG